jgi:hypothetical protein
MRPAAAALLGLGLAGCEGPNDGATRGTFGVGEGCDRTCTLAGEAWRAPEYTEDDIVRLEALELVDPPAPLDADPYLADSPPSSGPGVCAVRRDGDRRYALVTYPSADAATRDGARPTHAGACGVCSPLEDLAVYLRVPDLTTPVRECALEGVFGDDADVLSCLEDLGFTHPCAQIWAFNAENTRRACLEICFSHLDAPFNAPDGTLNPCLACDEEKSGSVFKAVAGRTRRRSGVPTAICRSCLGVFPAEHRY